MKNGRPKTVNIDEKKFRELMQLKPKLSWVANFFDCSEDSIHNYCHETFGQSFSEFRDKMMMSVRANLIMRAIDGAIKGNTALHIFCLKNLCGWEDMPSPFNDDSQDHEMLFKS